MENYLKILWDRSLVDIIKRKKEQDRKVWNEQDTVKEYRVYSIEDMLAKAYNEI